MKLRILDKSNEVIKSLRAAANPLLGVTPPSALGTAVTYLNAIISLLTK